MRCIILLVFLVSFQTSFGQNFLDAYKDFYSIKIRNDKTLDSIRKSDRAYNNLLSKKEIRKSKKEALRYLKSQILQFDTLFRNYKMQHDFDFNHTDSLIIVLQRNIESGLSDFIIFSGKDTLMYGEEWSGSSWPRRKKITFRPFLDFTAHPQGINVVTDRDSLLILALNRNCGAVQLLADENKALDGATSTILWAKKINGKYILEECFMPSFGFPPVWRKE